MKEASSNASMLMSWIFFLCKIAKVTVSYNNRFYLKVSVITVVGASTEIGN